MAAEAATATRNLPRILTKRKGRYASIARSGAIFLHSVQAKQKMPTTVGSGTRQKTLEEP